MSFNVCVSDQFIDMSFITFFEALHSNMEKIAIISPPVKIQYSEAAVRRCSVKKVFLEILQNSQENNCVRDSFLIKLQAKTISETDVSREFCEISKNTFFTEHLRATASEYYN